MPTLRNEDVSLPSTSTPSKTCQECETVLHTDLWTSPQSRRQDKWFDTLGWLCPVSSTICELLFSPERKHSSFESLVESPNPLNSFAFNDSLWSCMDILLTNDMMMYKFCVRMDQFTNNVLDSADSEVKFYYVKNIDIWGIVFSH